MKHLYTGDSTVSERAGSGFFWQYAMENCFSLRESVKKKAGKRLVRFPAFFR